MSDLYNQVAEAVEEVLSDYILVVRCKRCLYYDAKKHYCEQICRVGESYFVDEDFYCGDGIRRSSIK